MSICFPIFQIYSKEKRTSFCECKLSCFAICSKWCVGFENPWIDFQVNVKRKSFFFYLCLFAITSDLLALYHAIISFSFIQMTCTSHLSQLRKRDLSFVTFFFLLLSVHHWDWERARPVLIVSSLSTHLIGFPLFFSLIFLIALCIKMKQNVQKRLPISSEHLTFMLTKDQHSD